MAGNGSEQCREKYLELLARHGRIAPAVARLYADSAEERADLEQEIRLQWWRSLAGFSGRSLASTWMYQVALHTALTQLRRRRRRPPPDPLPDDREVADPAPHPGAAESHRRRLLHRALAELGPGERALAYLWLEECSYEEIAAVTGLQAGAVGVKLHRIRSRLRDLLAGKEGRR